VAQNIANTVVFGFRGAKNIGIYGVLCSDSFKKNENSTSLTIFEGTPKCDKKICGKMATSCGMQCA
jgi:hypothetical protein